jgi:hypothetical protein
MVEACEIAREGALSKVTLRRYSAAGRFRMGIVGLNMLLRKALPTNFYKAFVPALGEPSYCRDQEQDCSPEHSCNDAGAKHEDGSLRSSGPPKQVYDLMPASVHLMPRS